MADYDDVKISGLIINNLTQAKYDELLAAGKIDPNQIYCTEQGDYTTNEDFNSAIGTINESIEGLQTNKADKSDTYTKAEVDAKVSSVYRFVGSVATVDALPTDATVGDTYNVEADGSNYAWDGENWDKLSETVDLTPYLTKEEAGSTYETIENANLHKNNTSNPHQVTKAQVGLGNVDNTSDLEKPVSNLQQAALDLKQNVLVQGENITITGNTISAKDTTYTAGDGIDITNGIISNTRVSAEWGNVTGDITAQEDLQSALNLKADKSDTYTKSEVDGAIKTVDDKVKKNTEDIATLNTNKANASDLSSHTSSTSNPHNVTKVQVGLGNVDNTADLDKPISTATQAALDEKQNALTAGTGISLESDTIAVSSDVIINNTPNVDNESLSIGNTKTIGKNTGRWGIHIGSMETVNYPGAISIGRYARPKDLYGISIGFGAAAAYSAVGIGYDAEANKRDSVQLGDGANNTEGSLQFRDYPLVDADGNVYFDRLTENSVTKISTIPEVTSDYSGLIVQYVGPASGTYINGYFYKAVFEASSQYTVKENTIGFNINSIDAAAFIEWFKENSMRHSSDEIDYSKKFSIVTGYDANDLKVYYNYNESYDDGDYEADLRYYTYESGIDFSVSDEYIETERGTVVAEFQIIIDRAEWVQVNVQPTQDLSPYARNSDLESVQNTLTTKADKSNTYTKAEVDAKVSSVYRFMGSVANQAALPTEGQVIGDTYNAEDTGANYAWNGEGWDKLSETIDLTPYLTKAEAEDTFETIASSNSHKNNKENPHAVTKAQVGLGNVDNTADLDKPISTATQTALNNKADKSTTYTKTEVDGFLGNKLDKSEAQTTYATKEDLNNIDALPSQTGNSGKYLTTNGTEASWASFPPVATLKQW
jgi:hypothetical protein